MENLLQLTKLLRHIFSLNFLQMGARGPGRLPTKLKELRGTTRRDRRPVEEPQVEILSSLPDPPEPLIKAERKIWDSVTYSLFHMGYLSSVDFGIIVRLARESNLYSIAVKKLRIGGLMQAPDKNGVIRVNPYYKIVKDLSNSIRLMERELGLTPSARASLDISKIKTATAPPEQPKKGLQQSAGGSHTQVFEL